MPYVMASVTCGGVFMEVKSVSKVRRAASLVSVDPWEVQDKMCCSVSADV